MDNDLDQFQALLRQVVQSVAFELKIQQFPQIVPVFMREQRLCLLNKIVVYAGQLSGSILFDRFFTCVGVAGSEIQQRIAMVKQRSQRNDPIRFAVHEEAEITVVTISSTHRLR